MDNEQKLAECEAEREYHAANDFDVDASDEFDNPQRLIDEKILSDEMVYDEHKENCAGCALCEPDL